MVTHTWYWVRNPLVGVLDPYNTENPSRPENGVGSARPEKARPAKRKSTRVLGLFVEIASRNILVEL